MKMQKLASSFLGLFIAAMLSLFAGGMAFAGLMHRLQATASARLDILPELWHPAATMAVSQHLSAGGASPEELTIPAGESRTLTQRIQLRQPQLWSPESPALDRLFTTLSIGNEVADGAGILLPPEIIARGGTKGKHARCLPLFHRELQRMFTACMRQRPAKHEADRKREFFSHLPDDD